MRVRNKTYIRGVHRVAKRLSDGTRREYHNVYRGGPKFWSNDMEFGEGDPRYVAAYQLAEKGTRQRRTADPKSVRAVLERYRSSAEFVKLKPRTQKDYISFLNDFESEFGPDPIAMFEEVESVGEIRQWRTKWAHSPKRYDYAGTVVTRFLNWACASDTSLRTHHHTGQKKLYKSERTSLIWKPEEVQALLAAARPAEARVIVAASEGGLAPQDIGALRLTHVQTTPRGRRLFLQRGKTKNPVSIPVTEALGDLIDTVPEGQAHIVTSLTGRPLTALRASQIIRVVKERHNAKTVYDPSLMPIRNELHPYDLRGTAATALLRAGCSLNEIAVTMGWGLRHAGNVIESYAALVPEVSDEVLRKLVAARSGAV